MTRASADHRFYGELARWWPLISPPEEYADEAAFFAGILASATTPVRTILELGSGGGNNAAYLKQRFTMTLVDLSAEMLEVSRALNPECEHVEGDMRSVRLGRTFDAVFVHDAVDYMTTEDDLRRAVETAFAHCRDGGVAMFVPDATTEIFEPDTDHGGHDAPDGSGARYLGWTWDPDPSDSWVVTEYAFLLRSADGSTRCVHETHRIGVFSRAVWQRILNDVGFEPVIVTEQTAGQHRPRDVVLGRRPAR